MKHFEFFKFLEKKDHLINKLSTLTPEQKQETIAFFNKHPNYESEIDWNRKDLGWKDFDAVLNKNRDTKSQIKKAIKKGIEGIEEGVDYEDLGEHDFDSFGKVHLYRPLTWKGSRVLASDKVGPKQSIYSEEFSGAEWCISYQKTDRYWQEYTEHSDFLFIFGENVPTKKVAVQIPFKADKYDFTIWNYFDHSYSIEGDPDYDDYGFTKLYNYAEKYLISIKHPLVKTSLRWMDFLQKNTNYSTGEINIKESMDIDLLVNMSLSELVLKDGEFIVQFGEVAGNFYCGNCNLKSLKGAPKKVGGNFSCDDNYLTSLEYAPREVGGYFNCGDNYLRNLEYAPEKVGSHLFCNGNSLETLKGAPDEVGGIFDCSHNRLVSLEGSPKKVGSNYSCMYNSLQSLKGAPRYVEGIFDCSNNKLTSLEGAPDEIGKSFRCSENSLITFKGAPYKVRRNFESYHNRVTSLEGSPRYIGGNFACTHRISDSAGKISLKGCPEYVGGNFTVYPADPKEEFSTQVSSEVNISM